MHYQVAVQKCTLAVSEGLRNWAVFLFLEEKGFTGQGHAETNLNKPNTDNWAVGVMSSLRRIGYPFTIWCDRLDLIHWSAVRTCLARREDRALGRAYISPLGRAALHRRSGVLSSGGLVRPPPPPPALGCPAPTELTPRTELSALPFTVS